MLAVDRLECPVEVITDQWLVLDELGLRHDGWRAGPGECSSLPPGYCLQSVFCRRGSIEYTVLCGVDGQPALICGRGGGIESLETYDAATTDGVMFVYGLRRASGRELPLFGHDGGMTKPGSCMVHYTGPLVPRFPPPSRWLTEHGSVCTKCPGG